MSNFLPPIIITLAAIIILSLGFFSGNVVALNNFINISKPYYLLTLSFFSFYAFHFSWKYFISTFCPQINKKVIYFITSLLFLSVVSSLILKTGNFTDYFVFYKSLILYLLIIATEVCLGLYILDKLHIQLSKFQKLAVGWVLGSYLSAWCVFSFGIQGANPVFIKNIIIVISLLLSRTQLSAFGKFLIKPKRSYSNSHLLWISIFSTFAMIYLFINPNRVATPIWHFDALHVHMAAPKSYLVDGYISFLPSLRVSFGTPMLQTHFTPLYAYFSDLGPKLFEAASLICTLYLTYSLCISKTNKNYSLLACAIVITTPLFIYMTGICYQGIPALAVNLSSICLALSIKRAFLHNKPIWGYFILIGFFLGIIYLTHVRSYITVFPIVWILIPLLISYLRKKQLSSAVKYFLVINLTTIIIMSPQLIRLSIETNNPFYPFATNIFGHNNNILSETDIYSLGKVLEDVGFGKSLSDFLSLPYRLVDSPQVYQGGGLKSIGSFFSLTILIIIFGIFRSHSWAFAYILSFFAFWFFKAQIMRYLLMIIPIFSIAYIHGAFSLFSKIRFFLWVQVIFICFLLLYHVPFIILEKNPMVLNEPNRNHFLRSKIQGYEALNKLNEIADVNDKIYALRLEGSKFVFKNPANVLGDYFGKYSFNYINGFESNIQLLRDAFKKWNVKYFLINTILHKLDTVSFIKRYQGKSINVISFIDSVLIIELIKDNQNTSKSNKLMEDVHFNKLPYGWHIGTKEIEESSDGIILKPGASIFTTLNIREIKKDTSILIQADIISEGLSSEEVKLQTVWMTEKGWRAKDQSGHPLLDINSNVKKITNKNTNMNLICAKQLKNASILHISITNNGNNAIKVSKLTASKLNNF